MVPIQNRSLTLRCPFKHSTKPAVSVPDLLTPNPVLCASARSLTLSLPVRLVVRPLRPSVSYHGRISVVRMWRESALLHGAISSATYRSARGDKHETCRSDVDVWVWWSGVLGLQPILKSCSPFTFLSLPMSQSGEMRGHVGHERVENKVNTSCKESVKSGSLWSGLIRLKSN